ncbi:kinase-like protein, partial [Cadophora sp. DSE1049]
MQLSSDLADGERRGAEDEDLEPTEQSLERISYLAAAKPPPDQTTTTTSFEFVRKLGYGSFGTVDEVLHPGTKTHFARKSIRASLHQSPPALAQARREVIALCSLRHVHIVGVVAYYTLEDQFSIIMSPVAQGNLSEYMLNDCSAPLIKSSNLSKWIGCLTSAVSYMHEKSWQHLDIKPSNVLVTGDHVMLSDFGGALLVDGSQPKISMESSCAVTPMYCAPELV